MDPTASGSSGCQSITKQIPTGMVMKKVHAGFPWLRESSLYSNLLLEVNNTLQILPILYRKHLEQVKHGIPLLKRTISHD